MRKTLCLLCLLIATHLVSAQSQKTAKPSGDKAIEGIDPHKFFNKLAWRNIGPFRGGRANAIAGSAKNDRLFFAGYTGGGVWKTTDGGLKWENVSDGYFNTGSIGDIAISESDENVIYVGTGEHAVRGVMTSYGDGVYKSQDGGKTWANMGLRKSRHIANVIVHPSNADLVYVAVQGAVHGKSDERGVYRSTDGGKNWRRTLYINDSTGISSLSMDRNNPRILYAASWQHIRLPWQVVSGGAGSGIYKSIDGGETWKKLQSGLPELMGKIGIDVSPANSNRVFAIIEAEKSKAGLYRSDNGGETWSLLSNDNKIHARSWYYMEVQADPKNENIVYVLNAPLTRSMDGGKTFSSLPVGHGDTHDLWINENNTQIMGLADDGGAEISYNQGQVWSSLLNQPTAQFYRVNTDNLFPYHVYGGQQDNTSVRISSRSKDGSISTRDWDPSAGCESASLAFDPDNPRYVYGGCYQGYIEEMDMETKEVRDVQAYPSLRLASEPKNMKYRFNWNAPIVVSRFDRSTIYHGANKLLKSNDRGNSWQEISPDLTRDEKAKQGLGGVPLTNEGAGGENYNTLYYIAESYQSQQVIWVGSDCGLVHITTNGGASWRNITPPDLKDGLIHAIEPSRFKEGSAYITASRYKYNDMGSYAFKTNDYGKTWSKINTGIAEDDFLNVIREDTEVEGLLYGGGERFFYISYNSGASWQPMQLNLPVVPITDLTIKGEDLVAATAGRAFWVLDNIAPLRKMKTFSAWNANQPIRIYAENKSPIYPGAAEVPKAGVTNSSSGINRVSGVILDYFLPFSVNENDTVTLVIKNESGRVVRNYTNRNTAFKPYPGGPSAPVTLPSDSGFNRFSWNFLGNDQAPDINGAFIYGSYDGHIWPPGKYSATLKAKGQESTASFETITAPNLHATAAQWSEKQQFMIRISDTITAVHQYILMLRNIRSQVTHYNELGKTKSALKALKQLGDSLVAKIDEWESVLIETRQKNVQDVINWPGKLNAEFFYLKSLADTYNPTITQGMYLRLTDLEKDWRAYRQTTDLALGNLVEQFTQLYKTTNPPPILW